MGPALAADGTWTVLLNTPNPADPKQIVWVRRSISTVPLAQALRDAGYEGYDDPATALVSLALTTTTNDSLFNQCWEWKQEVWVLSIAGYSGPPNNRCAGPQGQLPSADGYASIDAAKKTITQYEIRDINGDGYPDFVYNASPMANVLVPNPPPAQPGSFVGQFTETQRIATSDIGGSRDVKALLNVAGVHLETGSEGTSAFSAPTTLETVAPPGLNVPQRCGVSRWVSDPSAATNNGIQVQECGFEDVNGDGLVDLVRLTPTSEGFAFTAALGTGDVNASFFANASILLPGPIARVESDLVATDDVGHTRPRACPDPDPPSGSDATFPVQRTAGLRDLNGDGIPDYVVGNNSTGATAWSVYWGTGSGFIGAMPIGDAGSPEFELSLEAVNCSGNELASTTRGLYDLDGDGRPEVVTFSGFQFFDGTQLISEAQLDVYQLNAQQDPQNTSAGNVPSVPSEGRLTKIDNGYGESTGITYRSAKEDGTTQHLVPFPEIVVTSIGTTDAFGSPLMTPDQYAYGNAQLIFDPTFDDFRFPGYQRSVQTRVTTQQVFPPPTDGMATITDSYGLAAFDSSMDAKTRLNRYLKAGKSQDITVLSGTIGSDPWALLSVNTSNDIRCIAGTHYDLDTRLLPAGLSESEVCLDMVFPYDFHEPSVNSLGLDQCTQRGFVFQQAVLSWRGTPGTASPLASDATVLTDTEVQSVDDFGRITSVTQFNDLLRADDNLCTQTVYATPIGANERVLSAPVSRTTTSCATPTVPLVTYSKDIWEYDTSPAGVKLPPGKVSNGFVTAHTVSHLNLDTGASLGDIRVFDATYDPATGRLSTLTQTRDDGARQKHTWAYDPFGLVPVRVRTDAANANGTTTPFLQTIITRDPITLNALTTTDPNGTQNGNTFDGFNRALLSTVTPPGGTAGALSSTSYLGFAVGQTGGRRIVQKVFTDPVAPASVGTAAGRTGTVFLDQLGRELRTEVALGADYANQTVVTGDRSYDKLGRVRFEADPHLSTDASLYGTTYHFNTDGTPSCFIRGHGQQAFGNVTDEASERYPTCFSRFFANNQEAVHVRDAAALLADSPQAGVVEETIYSAIGQVLSRSTYKPNPNLVPLERATFRYDALGNLTGMARHQDPLSTATVTTSWYYDSLGQVLQMEEPDSAPQFRSYDNWGELTQVQWLDTTTNPATDRRTITQYDALGRAIHSEERGMDTEKIIAPEALKRAYRLSTRALAAIEGHRLAIRNIINRKDPRLLVVCGPCSVHDPKAALEYALRLKKIAHACESKLYVIIRTYFEKPRSVGGWKGLVYDPHMDGSCNVEEGLALARGLLAELAELHIPAASEILDLYAYRYLADGYSWISLGARTIESQPHRELISFLGIPAGMKNATNGNVEPAINAMLAAQRQHGFISIDDFGQASRCRSPGNRNTHIVLRGASGRPNYTAQSIRETELALAAAGLPPRIMVDCAHGNSNKDSRMQRRVATDVVNQIANGNDSIIGIMLESFLEEGAQAIPADLATMRHGCSVTDPCLSWDDTEELLMELAASFEPERSGRRIVGQTSRLPSVDEYAIGEQA